MDTFWSHPAVPNILAAAVAASSQDRDVGRGRVMGMSVLPAPPFPPFGERREIQDGDSRGHRMVWDEKDPKAHPRLGSPPIHQVASALPGMVSGKEGRCWPSQVSVEHGPLQRAAVEPVVHGSAGSSVLMEPCRILTWRL